jgi:hypothetical protein
MKLRIFRNNVAGAPRWQVTKLPINQTAVWLGPLFILIGVAR